MEHKSIAGTIEIIYTSESIFIDDDEIFGAYKAVNLLNMDPVSRIASGKLQSKIRILLSYLEFG